MINPIHILGAGDDDIGKIISVLVVFLIWVGSAIVNYVAKRKKDMQIMRERSGGVVIKPPSPPPVPTPPMRALQPPTVRRKTPPARPQVPSKKSTATSTVPLTAFMRQAPAYEPPAAPMMKRSDPLPIKALLTPRSLKQQFILTEIFQPPISLRE